MAHSMKAVVLLALALFLTAAPTPTPTDVAELTANFIVPEQGMDLLAHFIKYLGRDQVP